MLAEQNNNGKKKTLHTNETKTNTKEKECQNKKELKEEITKAKRDCWKNLCSELDKDGHMGIRL